MTDISFRDEYVARKKSQEETRATQIRCVEEINGILDAANEHAPGSEERLNALSPAINKILEISSPERKANLLISVARMLSLKPGTHNANYAKFEEGVAAVFKTCLDEIGDAEKKEKICEHAIKLHKNALEKYPVRRPIFGAVFYEVLKDQRNTALDKTQSHLIKPREPHL